MISFEVAVWLAFNKQEQKYQARNRWLPKLMVLKHFAGEQWSALYIQYNATFKLKALIFEYLNAQFTLRQNVSLALWSLVAKGI